MAAKSESSDLISFSSSHRQSNPLSTAVGSTCRRPAGSLVERSMSICPTERSSNGIRLPFPMHGAGSTSVPSAAMRRSITAWSPCR